MTLRGWPPVGIRSHRFLIGSIIDVCGRSKGDARIGTMSRRLVHSVSYFQNAAPRSSTKRRLSGRRSNVRRPPFIVRSKNRCAEGKIETECRAGRACHASLSDTISQRWGWQAGDSSPLYCRATTDPPLVTKIFPPATEGADRMGASNECTHCISPVPASSA